MIRLLHCLIVMGLVGAAGYVYDIKYRSISEAQRAQKLRNEIAKEKDLIALARADWAKLASPDRIQDLASRHLKMKPVASTRFGDVSMLPERPKPVDAIGDILQAIPDLQSNDVTIPDQTATGSVEQPQ
jgi:hypothetical protein